jgi:hypothetical protein
MQNILFHFYKNKVLSEAPHSDALQKEFIKAHVLPHTQYSLVPFIRSHIPLLRTQYSLVPFIR